MKKYSKHIPIIDEHKDIERLIHILAGYAYQGVMQEFVENFTLLKLSFQKHFNEEEKLYGFQLKNQNEHQKAHSSFLNRLNKFEKQLNESNERRVHILADIQNWLIEHSLLFDRKLIKKETKLKKPFPSYNKTSIELWKIFKKEFGELKNKIWYFKNDSSDRFHYGINYFQNSLWVLPLQRDSDFPFDFESTAYVSNYFLSEYSSNLKLNEFFEKEITVFKTAKSSILVDAKEHNELILMYGMGDLCENDFITCGGLDTINVSVEFINRKKAMPSIIDLSTTNLVMDAPMLTRITDHSRKIFDRYNTKTAVVTNESVDSAVIEKFNTSSKHSPFTKLFSKDPDAVNWLL